MGDQSKRDTVFVSVYPETRRRINIHSAARIMTQADYIDSVIPKTEDTDETRG